MENKLTQITKLVSIFLSVSLGLYILYKNFPIFGDKVILTGDQVTSLAPDTRVINFPKPIAQVGDFVYFNTKSKGYDTAKISFTFKNTDSNSDIHIGYKDESYWHYKTKPILLSLIENLDWKSIKGEPTLYQKVPTFDSVRSLLNAPPLSPVGTYYMDHDHYINSLPGYTPDKNPTVIDQPLRGTHTFYTYLKNEQFQLNVEKYDLNWYKGADLVEISVFKDGLPILQKVIEDDGITDDSRVVMPVMSGEVMLEGKAKNGVYKVVIKANGDTVIKSLHSSFSRIVFENSVFPVGGSNVYDTTNPQANPSIYTDAQKLTFTTAHQVSAQTITINDKNFEIDEIGFPLTFDSGSNRNFVNIPKGDAKVEGAGYFAFKKEQYFTPFIYHNFQIKTASDLVNINYLLTDYTHPVNLPEGWRRAVVEFDLNSAYYSDGTLSWIIKSPTLKDRGAKIYIKDIVVELTKKSLINF